MDISKSEEGWTMLNKSTNWTKKKERKKKKSRRIAYLKPYSDITTAGSPFPTAIISSFSNLRK